MKKLITLFAFALVTLQALSQEKDYSLIYATSAMKLVKATPTVTMLAGVEYKKGDQFSIVALGDFCLYEIKGERFDLDARSITGGESIKVPVEVLFESYALNLKARYYFRDMGEDGSNWFVEVGPAFQFYDYLLDMKLDKSNYEIAYSNTGTDFILGLGTGAGYQYVFGEYVSVFAQVSYNQKLARLFTFGGDSGLEKYPNKTSFASLIVGVKFSLDQLPFFPGYMF